MLSKWLLMLILLIAAPVSAGEYGTIFLKDFEGAVHSLEEYTGKGKWTVMMIWASDCHACNAEAKQYVKFYKAHQEKDAALLGVSMDGKMRRLNLLALPLIEWVTFTGLLPQDRGPVLQGESKWHSQSALYCENRDCVF